jgi:FtsZ-interacting cell division protein ZipA
MNEEQSVSKHGVEQHEVPKNAVLIIVIAVIVVVLALMYLWVSKHAEEPIVKIEDNTLTLEEFMATERPSLEEEVAQFDEGFSSIRVDVLDSDISEFSTELDGVLSN